MSVSFRGLRLLTATGMIAVLAACQTPAPPPPPPTPQPQYAPRAPTTPYGASINTLIPPIRPQDGLRQTINRDLGPLETLWHVRGGLNVAALSCTSPIYASITPNYNTFLKNNNSYLRNANTAIISKFRREIGTGYRAEHDRHQTRVYNFWSFSPLRRPFCDKALVVSQKAALVDSSTIDAFGAESLAEMEQPFNEFYLAYEQYERDLDAWRRTYAPEQAVDARDETINTEGLTGDPIDPEVYENAPTDGIIDPPTES